MPNGKAAGTRCLHLGDDNLCQLFGKPERPAICSSFQPSADACGATRSEAFVLIAELEKLTAPAS